MLLVDTRKIDQDFCRVIPDVLKDEAISCLAEQSLSLSGISKRPGDLSLEPCLPKFRPQIRKLLVELCVLVKDFRCGRIVS